MANQYVNKVIVGNEVKIDLTGDDITAEKLAAGIKAHDKSGAPIVGTCPFDTDTSEATASAAEELTGKTVGAGGEIKTGSMPGSEGMKPQAKSVTPAFSSQEVLPDSDYNCLSSVTVAAIPVSYTDNAQGGQTLKVG